MLYQINVDDVDFEIDLAAEQLLAAQRDRQKIAVEVKSFISHPMFQIFILHWDNSLIIAMHLKLLNPIAASI
ncbi:element excision factor XisH family protein [Microcoleus sp. S36b_A3]